MTAERFVTDVADEAEGAVVVREGEYGDRVLAVEPGGIGYIRDEERHGHRQEGGQTAAPGKVGPEPRDQERRGEREADERRPNEPEPDLASGGKSREKQRGANAA